MIQGDLVLKAAVQGASCGLVVAFALLFGGSSQAARARAEASQGGVPDVVRARRFEVVDGKGRIRAVLQVTKYGYTQLEMFTQADAATRTPRADFAENGQVSLRVDEEYGGVLDLSAPPKTNRFVSGLQTSLGVAQLSFKATAHSGQTLSPKLSSRFLVNTFNEGDPYLSLRDQLGNVVWSAP